MVAVYFFYGLAFFSLGLVTAIYPKHRTDSWFASNIRLIAAFALLHGANEWVDMFALLHHVEWLETLAFVLGAMSFLCLLWFGVASLVSSGAPRVTYALLAVLPVSWLVFALLAAETPNAPGIAARYLLATPGTILTAVALWKQSTRDEAKSAGRLLRLAAVAFVVYGVASGLVGPAAPFFPASIINQTNFSNWTGVPIQIVRTGLAVMIALSVTGILKVFNVDVRDHLKREVAARTRELRDTNTDLQREIDDRVEREFALRESEARYRDLFENAYDAIFIVDSDLKYVDVNKRAIDIFGYSREEFLSMTIVDMLPEDQLPKSQVEFDKLKERRAYERFVGKSRAKTGHLIDIEVSSSPIVRDDQVVGSRDVVRDITDRIHLEQQLLQAQKMEAVGQLAGGIAHDFNNILTAILGYGELMKPEIDGNSRLTEWLQAMIDAAEKAAGLTTNLLAFSRKQIMRMRPIDLNEVIRAAGKLLLRSIGEDVELVTRVAGGALVVIGDENQLTQVVLNLATNARDAMPDGGTLTISVDRVDSRAPLSLGDNDLPAGLYALLSVADTGQGMDEQTSEKIFEPFYTTKEVGRGTGLGLSTAYGIIKQHHGGIHVRSQPGQGTAMRIYLPIHDGHSPDKVTSKKRARPEGGSETLLLAEDDDVVRELMAQVLAQAGYRVIAACDGLEAVEQFAESPADIDLAILDVIMSKMNGKEVYEEICRLRSDVKTMFVTGYAADILRERGLTAGGPRIVNKPVAPDDLLLAVRETLDQD